MAERYLLDTDVIIEYLRGSAEAVDYLEGLEGELLLSSITVAELWSGVKGEQEQKSLEQFMLAFGIVSVDERIARRGGEFRRRYASSHGTGLAEALIAASAEQAEALMVSFNARHYPMLSEIEVPYER